MPLTNSTNCNVYSEMEAFPYFYYLIFLVGFIGSCFALWTFKNTKRNHKSMNVYLLNLLTADFLLTLALPVKIIIDLGVAPWKLKIFHCQVTACLIYTNMYLSIIFLGFVSMDRCLQLIHQSKIYRIQEPGFAKMISVVVWTLVLFFMVPNMAIPIKEIKESPTVGCIDFKTEVGRDWHLFTNFICSVIFLNCSAMVLISNCLVIRLLYQNKYNDSYENVKKAMVNILIVTASYIICFLPYHIVRIPYTLSQSKAITTDCSLKQSLFKAKESTLLFGVSNLCFDPILYFYLSKTFRLKVTKTFGSSKDRNVLPNDQIQHGEQTQLFDASLERLGALPDDQFCAL
ncbi:probable G-protein coupled receptor 171 [Varanus komodoensis]|uniref:G-protein coupled receptor 171 n=1 Tax=Varanus komodoensis TaxID=61221 RepID=A0A8D2LNF0_VARKO|nr:probable G-protein coupled receptor 171 [Varanus komodoensis]